MRAFAKKTPTINRLAEDGHNLAEADRTLSAAAISHSGLLLIARKLAKPFDLFGVCAFFIILVLVSRATSMYFVAGSQNFVLSERLIFIISV